MVTQEHLDKARGLLRLLWQIHDRNGHSMGRSTESRLLETAMDLLGDCPSAECRAADANPRGYLEEARVMATEMSIENVESTDLKST